MSGDAAIVARIQALHTAYAHAIDDDRLEDWPGFFTEDALYRIQTRENHELGLPLAVMQCEGIGMLRDRVTALRTANIYEPHSYCHLIGPPEIADASGPDIRVRSNFAIMRTMHSGATTAFACGRYLDRIVEIDGTLKLAERHAICESRTVDTLLVIPL